MKVPRVQLTPGKSVIGSVAGLLAVLEMVVSEHRYSCPWCSEPQAPIDDEPCQACGEGEIELERSSDASIGYITLHLHAMEE